MGEIMVSVAQDAIINYLSFGPNASNGVYKVPPFYLGRTGLAENEGLQKTELLWVS